MAAPFVPSIALNRYTIEANGGVPGQPLTNLVYDNFQNYTGVLAGKMPVTGSSAWTVGGSGVPTVTSNYMVGNGTNAYPQLASSATPYLIYGVFDWSSGSPAATIACLLNAGSLNDMVHCNFGNTTMTLTYWKTGSGSSIAPTYSLSDTYTALVAGQKYAATIVLAPPFVDYYIENYDTGVLIGSGRAYDANFASIVGPNAFWQTPASSNVRWYYVGMRARPSLDTADNLTARAGLEDTPIGLTYPRPARFNQVMVGSGSPIGSFTHRAMNSTDLPTFEAAASANGVLRCKAQTSGFTGELHLLNGAGGTGKIKMDGAYALTLEGNNGTVFLTKPANAGTPYFAAAVGVGGSSGPTWTSGSGSPEGVVTAPVGSLYSRTNGGASTSLYVKESGTGNTGWVAK